MTHIAFLGTGLMGEPMASRLLDAGHRVTVWNRTASKTAALVTKGAQHAASPAEAVRGCEVTITMLSDPRALESVVGDCAAEMEMNSTFIDMSTVGPDCVLALAATLRDDVTVMDAPVLGSVPQAIDGSLEIFAGGSDADFDSHRSLLEEMGRPRHVGPLGAGAALKLVVNAALVDLQCVLGECLALGDAFDLPEAVVLDAMAVSSLGTVVSKKRSNIESGDYTPRFTLDNGAKDAALVEEAARTRGIPLRLAPEARAWFESAKASGLGAEDYCAVVKEIRRAG